MAVQNLNWKTSFNQSEHTMTDTFSDRIKVVTNFSDHTITSLKDGQVVSRMPINDMTLYQYEQFLCRIASSAEELKKFKV